MQDYKYSGKVNIEEVLFNKYKETVSSGKKLRRSTFNIRSVLELHNEGMTVREISDRTIKTDGTKAGDGSIRYLLESMSVKPNTKVEHSDYSKYKGAVITKDMYHRLVIESVARGVGLFETALDLWNGRLIVHSDAESNMSVDISASRGLLAKLMDNSNAIYITMD